MALTALVTGGGTGIGRGISLALARRGYCVALVGRRGDLLETVAREIERLGSQALVLPADLSRPDKLAAVIERVRVALGPLDILVNNAATLAGGNLSSLTGGDIQRAVATNLTAPIELTRLALPDLAARKGAVILVGSTMSFVPMPSAPLYSATKAGIRALAGSLRYELEPFGVRLLIAYPPATNTGLTRPMLRASGLPSFPLRNPALVGEKIVAALMSGRQEIVLSKSDRAMAFLYNFAPRLVRAVFRTQRTRFARMMRPR